MDKETYEALKRIFTNYIDVEGERQEWIDQGKPNRPMDFVDIQKVLDWIDEVAIEQFKKEFEKEVALLNNNCKDEECWICVASESKLWQFIEKVLKENINQTIRTMLVEEREVLRKLLKK